MVSSLRKAFNANFGSEKYEAFLQDLDSYYPKAIGFRLAETPVFVPKNFAEKMFDVCESIIDLIKNPLFLQLTETSIPPSDKVPGEYSIPQMIAFDFGVCTNEDNEPVPQLVEMQGFPSLYGFQSVYPDLLRQHFPVPENYSQYLSDFTMDTYVDFLAKTILGGHSPENVILLEIKPEDQKTRIDFYCTRDLTGIQPVCITELIREGDQLYYLLNGNKTLIKRIYNRIVFDELNSRDDLGSIVDITKPLDVEWVPHPDWFYRISKYTLPYINHPYVPATYFLNEVKQLPADLENYVLKPLFSFAGQGVVIDIEQADLDRVKDPENWILQKKVRYAAIIETPDEPAKTEIRIMYLWHEGSPRPRPAINLARLSKGKMIGTRYNDNKKWVGGSVAFFER